jgi:hypothetical protein
VLRNKGRQPDHTQRFPGKGTKSLSTPMDVCYSVAKGNIMEMFVVDNRKGHWSLVGVTGSQEKQHDQRKKTKLQIHRRKFFDYAYEYYYNKLAVKIFLLAA